MSWSVSGAAAVVRVAGMSLYLGRGDRVPGEAEEASVKHLAEIGLIVEVEADPKAETKPAARKR